MFQIKDGFIPTEGYVQFDLKFISNNYRRHLFTLSVFKAFIYLHQHLIAWFSWIFFRFVKFTENIGLPVT